MGFLERAPILGALLLFWAATAAAETVTVRVSHALDGDTLALTDGRHVRLIGINAPELGRDGRVDEPLARAARERLTGLAARREVQLVFERDGTDRHGRLLAHALDTDGHNLQEILLAEGLAGAVAVAPNFQFLARYLAVEAQARAARRGMWGEPYFIARAAAEQRDRGFVFVADRIDHLRKTRRFYYFAFGTDLFLVVSRDHWAAYWPGRPEDLVGRRAEARGWLSDGRHPRELRLYHPAMLRTHD